MSAGAALATIALLLARRPPEPSRCPRCGRDTSHRYRGAERCLQCGVHLPEGHPAADPEGRGKPWLVWPNFVHRTSEATEDGGRLIRTYRGAQLIEERRFPPPPKEAA